MSDLFHRERRSFHGLLYIIIPSTESFASGTLEGHSHFAWFGEIIVSKRKQRKLALVSIPGMSSTFRMNSLSILCRLLLRRRRSSVFLGFTDKIRYSLMRNPNFTPWAGYIGIFKSNFLTRNVRAIGKTLLRNTLIKIFFVQLY